ncbi:acetyltransferase [Primorskyibacter sp. 2E233]|uniref:acetyltransferase n=1 Tax=Primorskyibacter sp. 2E233 TaxID=3413431 RepID=UPI003BF0BEFE
MPGKLIILGAGGHGRVVSEAAMASAAFDAIAFVDNTPGLVGQRVLGVPVVAATLDAELLDGAQLHVAIGDNATRKRVSEQFLQRGQAMATVRHPSAIISPSAQIGAGCAIMAAAIVQCGTRIGSGVILNTGAQIDHDGLIEDYCHISPGAVLTGNVTVGTESWIGAGATIRNGITVGPQIIVGIGAAVDRDLSGPGARFGGVPARLL